MGSLGGGRGGRVQIDWTPAVNYEFSVFILGGVCVWRVGGFYWNSILEVIGDKQSANNDKCVSHCLLD